MKQLATFPWHLQLQARKTRRGWRRKRRRRRRPKRRRRRESPKLLLRKRNEDSLWSLAVKYLLLYIKWFCVILARVMQGIYRVLNINGYLALVADLRAHQRRVTSATPKGKEEQAKDAKNCQKLFRLHRETATSINCKDLLPVVSLEKYEHNRILFLLHASPFYDFVWFGFHFWPELKSANNLRWKLDRNDNGKTMLRKDDASLIDCWEWARAKNGCWNYIKRHFACGR